MKVCLTALALLWPPGPGGRAPYPDHTLVDQAVHAARRRVGSTAGGLLPARVEGGQALFRRRLGLHQRRGTQQGQGGHAVPHQAINGHS